MSAPAPRNYAMFEAELSGAVLNLALLRRLMRWLRPYRITFAVSGVLVLVASTLQVLMPVVLSLVVIDHIIQGETASAAPDLGMIDLTEWLASVLALPPLAAACLLYVALQVAWAVTGHAHRMTLVTSVINGLRDLRLDLFRHLETRPSSFYDRVAVGRIMTRVTNDIEALYELLRGIGSLIGEFVPFFVALSIMLAIDVQLTLMLLLVLPVMGGATAWFRRNTREMFRKVRASVSALNQNLQENLAGLQVVQLSVREDENLARYTRINAENRRQELKSARSETLYGAFTDSMAHVAIGVIIWYGGGAVVQDQMTLGGVILFTRFIALLFQPLFFLFSPPPLLFLSLSLFSLLFPSL
ncbi:MAG: ABC transporter ATP-binding protein, partial [Gammaproteobacteria bacterium]